MDGSSYQYYLIQNYSLAISIRFNISSNTRDSLYSTNGGKDKLKIRHEDEKNDGSEMVTRECRE